MLPPLRTPLLSRARLLERISVAWPLVVISASAGAGKTTLLSTWARSTDDRVGWLTLTEADNDPTRFWNMVLTALRYHKMGAILPDGREPPLPETELPPLLEAAWTHLLNTLVESGERTTLILDDYQVIEEPLVHQSLAFLIQHAPPPLRIVLATRHDPPLPLPRLRARGQLVELRDADLHLSLPETATFLQMMMEEALTEGEVFQLFQRTQGWVAGLQLAVLAMRAHPNRSTFIQTFSGTHRFLLDYLRQEILSHLDSAHQDFLLRTSIVSSMTASLAERLTGCANSQKMLEELEHANLFLIPLSEERRWYGYHPLFRDALRAQLQATMPETVKSLHHLACDWYAEQSMFTEALEQALSGTDWARAMDLLSRVIRANQGEEGLIPPTSARKPLSSVLCHLAHQVDEGTLTNFASSLILAYQSCKAEMLPTPNVQTMRESFPQEHLTPQERRVLLLMAEGASNQEIARRLVIGLSTAKKHVSHLLAKLGVQSRIQAVQEAQKRLLL
ncbi:MAG: hypothetical protein JO202_03250 [Ktedonobacteraceae bacterium]|nr:hypothetical protein [Ktedonobacteraceae bacterium]